MVACQLPKLNARVRFPLPAPTKSKIILLNQGDAWWLHREAAIQKENIRALRGNFGQKIPKNALTLLFPPN